MAAKTAKRSATAKARTQSQKAANAAKNADKPAAKGNGKVPSGGKREAALKRDLELAPKVAAMRDDGKSWEDIKEKLGIDQPKGQVLFKLARVKPKDLIKLTGDSKADAALVTEARDKGELSWADISVRTGVSMGKVKALYAGSGKDPAASRLASGAGRKPAAKPADAKAGKAKPAAPKKNRKKGKVAADPSLQG